MLKNNWFTHIFAICFLTLALLSFEYAEYFSLVFIIFLLGLILRNLTNANIISVALILLLERFLEHFILLTLIYPLTKPVIYILSLYIAYKLKYDSLTRHIILPTIIIGGICEIYWFYTKYNAPILQGYIALLILNGITRHLIFMRVPTFKKYQAIPYFQKKVTSTLSQTSFDLPLYILAQINMILIAMMIGEYLIRHLTPFSPLFVYKHYSEIAHILTFMAVFFITTFIFQSKFKIKA